MKEENKVDTRSDFSDVGEFHAKFGLTSVNVDGPRPRFLDDELMAFRHNFLREELDEIEESFAAGDLPGVADGLVDLVYVALGTAHMMGLPWEDLWAEVQRANMTKMRAPSASASKRGSAFDVVKPAGWEPPAIAAVLAKHGWQCDGNHPAPRCGNPNCWHND